MIPPSLEEVRAWDRDDPFRGMRGTFSLPDKVIYLDGNSLGALPLATKAVVTYCVEHEWGRGLIRSWNDADWIEAPQRVGAKIARLIGAKAHEVVAADSTSVNLFKLLAAAIRAQSGRTTILTEPGNFPTDLYMAQGLAELIPGVTVRTVDRSAIVDAIDADVAVVMLTQVHYKTGHKLDMDAVTRVAHAQGALMLWDLSHSAGAIAVDLNAAQADLAVGCGYKYLNGGPGAPAYLFVAERHHERLRSPLTGWQGHRAPFAFDDAYEAASGVQGFLCGTPPVIGLAALEASLDLFSQVDMGVLAEKGQRLCQLFIDRVEAQCEPFGMRLITPRDPAGRGSHVSFAHPDGYPIVQALIASGVIGDFRADDVMRFGFAPLYLSFEDVWTAAECLSNVLINGTWRQPEYHIREAVT